VLLEFALFSLCAVPADLNIENPFLLLIGSLTLQT